MKNRATVGTVFLLVGLALFGRAGHPYAHAQTASQPATPVAAQQDVDSGAALTTLKVIEESVQSLEGAIRGREADLGAATSDQSRKQIADELNELSKRLEAARGRFETVATGIDLEQYTSKPRVGFDIALEVKDLLAPMIQQLKRMTARPRETEALRNQVADYQTRAEAAGRAVRNVSLLYEKSEDPTVKAQLKMVLDSWSTRAREAGSQLAVARLQLEDKLKDERSVWQSLQDAVREFFRSKGLNLLLSVSAFVATLLAFRFIRRNLRKRFPSLTRPRRSFTVRLGDVLYRVAMFVCAALAFMLTLYIMEDWALLGVAILFVLSLAWTAKQALPKFYQQYRLMLNLGTAKEGERLVYNGLPWQVVSLNLFARLENPELSGGAITLPLSSLVGVASRPSARDEPWFPCRAGDWVILSDGTRGKVLVQTPESVQLLLLGGSRKSYPTIEFLKQIPNNLSTNFRISSAFGLDYRHQAEATRDIPGRLAEALREGLAGEAFGPDILDLRVEFQEAAASSLNLVVIVDVSGRAARHYEEINRAVQRGCVEAANRFGWTIPFPQLTVHRRDP